MLCFDKLDADGALVASSHISTLVSASMEEVTFVPFRGGHTAMARESFVPDGCLIVSRSTAQISSTEFLNVSLSFWV